MESKKRDYSEHIERYLDCPYCGGMISDELHIVAIFEDQIIDCPHCGKEIQLGKCI